MYTSMPLPCFVLFIAGYTLQDVVTQSDAVPEVSASLSCNVDTFISGTVQVTKYLL